MTREIFWDRCGKLWALRLVLVFLVTAELSESRPPSFEIGFGNHYERFTKVKRHRGNTWASSPPMSHSIADATKHNLDEASVEEESDVRQWLELETAPPAKISAKLHSEVVLECVAVGSPPPVVYWLKDGKPIESLPVVDSDELLNGLDAELHSTLSGFSMAKVKTKVPIRCIRPEDEGVYSCVATQMDGPDGTGPRRTSALTTVVIEEDDKSEDWKPECEFRLPPFAFHGKKGRRGTPAFIHASESLHMEAIGNSVLLPCRAGGKPKPHIQWVGSDGQPMVLGKKYQINSRGDLVIKNLSWNEMGEYKCNVENPYGSETTSTFLYPLLPEER